MLQTKKLYIPTSTLQIYWQRFDTVGMVQDCSIDAIFAMTLSPLYPKCIEKIGSMAVYKHRDLTKHIHGMYNKNERELNKVSILPQDRV